MSDPQRERILACACELYLQDGLEGFSMRKLARAVGVTAPALYRYYGSKEHVLLEVVREAYRRLAAYLYRALEGRTPLERFRLAGHGYLDFAVENPRLYDVLYVAPDHAGWKGLPEDIESQACAIGQFWNDRVRECMDAGLLKRADPQAVALTLWGHAHGLVTLHLRGMLDTDEEGFRGLYRASSVRLFEGLGTTALAEELGAEAVAAADAPVSAEDFHGAMEKTGS